MFRDDLGEAYSVEDLQGVTVKKHERALDVIREARQDRAIAFWSSFIIAPSSASIASVDRDCGHIAAFDASHFKAPGVFFHPSRASLAYSAASSGDPSP